MATKTFYVLTNLATTPGWFGQLQDGGTAPTASNCAYGWAPGKLSGTSSNFCRARLGASGTVTTGGASILASSTGPQAGTGTLNTTAGDAFITPSAYTGSFVAGNWTFVINLIATTAGMTGQLGIRIWASANANGSSARELSSGVVYFPTANGIAVNTTATAFNYTWAAPLITLNNEYLFFEIEWKETTTGTNNSDNAFFRQGSSIVTTNFAQLLNANLAGAGGMRGATTTNYISSGRQVQYLFDDLTGADNSGNGNTGTFNGSYSLVPGKVGSAVDFNTGYVSFANTTNMGLATPTSEFSVCCWINSTNNNGEPIFCARNGSSILDLLLGYDGIGNSFTGRPALVISGSNGIGTTEVIGGTVNIADGTWHHVAVTRTSGQVNTIYVDGVSVGSGTDGLTAGIPMTTADTFVGRELAQTWQSVSNIDDFRYYNRALTSTEINTIATLGEIVTLAGPDLTIPAAGPRTYQLTAAWAGAGAASWTSVDPTDQLMQAKAAFGGLGGANWTSIQLMQAATALSGSGSLSVANLGKLLGTATFAGSGSLSGSINQWRATQATLAGTGALTASGLVFKQLQSEFDGSGSFTATATQLLSTSVFFAAAGTLSATVAQPLSASAFLAGAGALNGDVTILPGTFQWQGTALLAGAGLLTATGQLLSPLQGAFAGTGAFSAAAILQLNTTAAFAGSGTFSATGLVVKSLQSAFVGVGALSATVYQLLSATTLFAGTGALTATGLVLKSLQSAFAGAGALSATASLQLNTTAAFAGTSALAPASLGQWQSVQAAFPGIGGLTGAALVLKPLQAAFAGTGALSSIVSLSSPLATTLTGTGALTASTMQWLAGTTVFTGAGSLTSVLVIPGVPQGWSGNALLTGLGNLSPAALTQWLSIPAVLSGSGGLAATPQQLERIQSAFAGVGAFSASAALQLKTVAAFAGVGGLTSSAQLLQALQSALSGTGALTGAAILRSPAQATLVGNGTLTTSAAQWLAANTTFNGVGALIGDVTILGATFLWQGTALLTGVGTLSPPSLIQRQALTTAFSGASALTATAQLLTPLQTAFFGTGGLTTVATLRMPAQATFSGAGAFSAFLSGVGALQGTALLTGVGALTANAAQWFAAGAVFNGAGSLTANISGVVAWQGTAGFAGIGTLTASTRMLAQVRGQFSGAGTLTVTDLQKPLGTAVLAGLGGMTGALQRWQTFGLTVSGTGALTASTIQRLTALPALWSGAGALTSSTIQLMNFAAVLTGTSALAAQLGAVFQLAAVYAGMGHLTGAIVIAQQDSTNVDLIEQLPSIPAMVARLQPSQITVTGQPAVTPITETEPEAQITAELPTATNIIGRTSRRVRIRTLH